MNAPPADEARRRPQSMPYYLTFCPALTGMVGLITAIGGLVIARGGGDDMKALNAWGAPGVVGVFLILYFQRLTYSRRLNAGQQARVRRILQAILFLEIVLSIAVAYFVFTAGEPAAGMRPIIIGALIFQLFTITWLVQYSRE
ncbi:hypothetical protein ACSBM8_02900 [Sphingomonas sp. ASY06-1R]|uniref:hypothetical protein n=1 Tax=Sphingomonas sp. ASY06-1R TaxID=3445771 RepID=UPI003FA1F13C